MPPTVLRSKERVYLGLNSPLRHQRFPRSQAWGFCFLCRIANGLLTRALKQVKIVASCPLGSDRTGATNAVGQADHSSLLYVDRSLIEQLHFVQRVASCDVGTAEKVPSEHKPESFGLVRDHRDLSRVDGRTRHPEIRALAATHRIALRKVGVTIDPGEPFCQSAQLLCRRLGRTMCTEYICM